MRGPGTLQRCTRSRQSRLELHLVAQGRVDGHDDLARANRPQVRVQGHDLATPVGNPPHRTPQTHLVAQLLGHSGAEDLRAADETCALRAVLDRVEFFVVATGRIDHGQEMQQPHFGRGDATSQRHAGIPAGPILRLDVLLGQPVADRELVQLSSPGGFPGGPRGDFARHLAQLASHGHVGAEGSL
ncbi:hypothetical protein D3C80_1442050 [compost metagenome]